MKNLFSNNLYIKVDVNKLQVKNVSESGRWISDVPKNPFTTNRLLVGVFTEAEPVSSGSAIGGSLPILNNAPSISQ